VSTTIIYQKKYLSSLTSHNQDIELPDQLTQAEFDTYIDHDQDTQCHGILTDEDIAASLLSEEPTVSRDQPDDSWYPADELCNFGLSFCCGKQLVNLSFKCVE
jgi:hypothetical protein